MTRCMSGSAATTAGYVKQFCLTNVGRGRAAPTVDPLLP